VVVCETIPTTNIITWFGSWKEETAPILPRSHKDSNGAVIASEAKHPPTSIITRFGSWKEDTVPILPGSHKDSNGPVIASKAKHPPTSIITRFGSWKEETAPILPGSHIDSNGAVIASKAKHPLPRVSSLGSHSRSHQDNSQSPQPKTSHSILQSTSDGLDKKSHTNLIRRALASHTNHWSGNPAFRPISLIVDCLHPSVLRYHVPNNGPAARH
jgi:hypothetical protein